jgi:hypothetical protein
MIRPGGSLVDSPRVGLPLIFFLGNTMRYEHKCQFCKFLGEFGEYDLYFCTILHFGRHYVVAKNDGGEDFSLVPLEEHTETEYPELKEAFRRAIEKEFYSII